jgi:hypothetical protein
MVICVTWSKGVVICVTWSKGVVISNLLKFVDED